MYKSLVWNIPCNYFYPKAMLLLHLFPLDCCLFLLYSARMSILFIFITLQKQKKAFVVLYDYLIFVFASVRATKLIKFDKNLAQTTMNKNNYTHIKRTK